MAEYANKSTPDELIDDSGNRYVTDSANNFALGYLFNNNVEVAGRFTITESDNETYSGLANQTYYTFGLYKFVRKQLLKIQSNFSLIETEGKEDNDN